MITVKKLEELFDDVRNKKSWTIRKIGKFINVSDI